MPEFATAGGDGVCEVWRVSQWMQFNTGDEMRCARYSLDGKRRVYVGAEGVLLVENTDGTFAKYLYQTEPERLHPVAGDISPDGSRVVTLAKNGVVLLFDVGRTDAPDFVRREISRHEAAPASVAFADGGRLISAGQDGLIVTIDVASGRVLSRDATGIRLRRVQPSPDGRYLALACADGAARVWDAERKSVVATLRPPGGGGALLCARFSANGRRLLAGGEGRKTYLWDWRAGTLLATFVGHTGAVNDATFAPGEATVATASEDTTVRLWSVPDALREARAGRDARTALVVRSHTGGVFTVDYAADGQRILTASQDGTTRTFPATPAAYLREAGHILAWRPAGKPGEGSNATPKRGKP
jgi:WD40 repeat protein